MKAMKRYSSLHSLTTEHHELASGWDWSGEAISTLRVFQQAKEFVKDTVQERYPSIFHLCFGFLPFLNAPFVRNFQPTDDSISDVCQCFFFCPSLRHATWQGRAFGDKPTRFILPDDDLQVDSHLMFAKLHVVSPTQSVARLIPTIAALGDQRRLGEER